MHAAEEVRQASVRIHPRVPKILAPNGIFQFRIPLMNGKHVLRGLGKLAAKPQLIAVIAKTALRSQLFFQEKQWAFKEPAGQVTTGPTPKNRTMSAQRVRVKSSR